MTTATMVPSLFWGELGEEVLKLSPPQHRPMMVHLLQVTRESAEDLSSRELARELATLFVLAACPERAGVCTPMEAAMH